MEFGRERGEEKERERDINQSQQGNFARLTSSWNSCPCTRSSSTADLGATT
jgi:hypothetical protein